MNPSTSIILDAFRFCAALLVVFHHAEQHYHSEWLKPLASFGHDAVVFFFLLSGYVIAHTARKKGRGLADYATARLARMYSVAAPALILAALVYGLGVSLRWPAHVPMDLPDWGRFVLASVTFLNQSLEPRVSVPDDVAYWSVCFEVWYYVLFAVVYYFRGWRRWALALLVAWIAGPGILVLAPIWWAGYVYYHRQHRLVVGARAAVALIVAGLALYFAIRGFRIDRRLYDLSAAWLGGDAQLNAALGWGKRFVVDYLIAAVMLIVLTGALKIGPLLEDVLIRHRTAISFLAGGSFSLYLFHVPLLTAASELGIPSPLGTLLTVLVSYGLAEFTERRKDWFAQVVGIGVGRVARLFDR